MKVSFNRQNAEIMEIILSQEEPFTVEDIIKKIITANLHINEEIVINIIKRLNDNGFINNYGTKYDVSSMLR